MAEFLRAGLVYVPAWFIGQFLAQYIDPFSAGWGIASAAVLIRVQILYRQGKWPAITAGRLPQDDRP